MKRIPEPAIPLVESASESAGVGSPFWDSPDFDARAEGMYQLAFELDLPDVHEFLTTLPAGYSHVHWIFSWEQSRAGEGFCTGTDNSGPEAVANAATAYEAIGMPEEAKALIAMLEQYSVTPNGYDEVEAAYLSVSNPYEKDWDRIPKVVDILASRSEEFFWAEA